jgi:hypothetical protein
MSTYSEKLKSPRWQRKRLEILERDSFACQNCQARDKTLHVHHKFYRKGADVWDYEDDAYMTLCEDCHSKITEQDKEISEILAKEVPYSYMKETFLEFIKTIQFGNFLFLIHEYPHDWTLRLYEALNTTESFLLQKELQNEVIEPEY